MKSKTMKTLSILTVLVLAFSLLASCGEQTPKSYHLTGETLIQQTNVDDSYRGGEMDLKEDGTAVFSFYTRAADSQEKSSPSVWTGTWETGSDGSVNITFESYPDDGGHAVSAANGHDVETQISLDETNLTAAKGSNGKLTVNLTVHAEIITFTIDQYTDIELVSD